MQRLFTLACFLLTFATTAPAAPVDPFTGFVGFGDSYSDKGRFGQLQPPSNAGRFTDGISWMETVQAAFAARGQGNFNLALGGATAGPANTNDPLYALQESVTIRDPSDPDDIPFLNLRNLAGQIGSFAAAGFDTLVGDNPLVTIFIGGNDFLQSASVDPATVIGSIIAGIQQVASLGPQFNSFMVATLPDLSIQPELVGAPQAVRDSIRAQTFLFNAALTASLGGLAGVTGLEIEMLDLFAVTDQVYAEAQIAGLILDDACTDQLTDPVFDPANNCLLPGSSADYLFMDNAHPGDFAHSRWAEAALTQIDGRLAPVPLPAGLPLLLTGLGLVVVLRRRAA